MADLKLLLTDLDDTLIHNAQFFWDARYAFVDLVIGPDADISARGNLLDKIEVAENRNIPRHGYHTNTFFRSLIDVLYTHFPHKIDPAMIGEISKLCDHLRDRPHPVMDDAADYMRLLRDLHSPAGPVKRIIMTLGGLTHQEDKITTLRAEMGDGWCFDDIEIVQRKDAKEYRRVIAKYGVQPSETLMFGDSLRSDILPMLEIGGHVLHLKRSEDDPAARWTPNRVMRDVVCPRVSSLVAAGQYIRRFAGMPELELASEPAPDTHCGPTGPAL